jgi:polar amino acid transport system substrate-binding protein
MDIGQTSRWRQAWQTDALRCVINLGNPLLAVADGDSARGVSVDMAHALASALGAHAQLVVVDNAREAVQALEHGLADIGFLAVDPLRAQHIAFTPPYLLIEGCYLVRADSPIQTHAQVDQADHRVVVGLGSAYDLYLSRALQHAPLVRAESSKAVVPTFLSGGHAVAAGVKHQLETDAQAHPGLRLLPGAFMQIQQAMATPKGKGEEAYQALCDFLTAVKASGFIRDAMLRHGVVGASLAP